MLPLEATKPCIELHTRVVDLPRWQGQLTGESHVLEHRVGHNHKGKIHTTVIEQ
jgi:hypothetical protein